MRPEQIPSTARLRDQLRVPIATGENLYNLNEFITLFDAQAVDIIQPDLCVCGGIMEGKKIAAAAEANYVTVAPHNPLGPVSAAACVALCMASTNVGVQEMPRRPGSEHLDLFPEQIGWADGYAFAPDRPGLGVVMDEAVAESMAAKPGGWPPLLRRNDGAFTNW